jgi:hypothetical protein
MMNAAGLVTRNVLDRRFVELEARLTWKIVGLVGVQIVIFSSITRFL